jgi:hypothetical protein
MNYAIQIGSDDMINRPSFTKTVSGIQKFRKGHRQTDRERERERGGERERERERHARERTHTNTQNIQI